MASSPIGASAPDPAQWAEHRAADVGHRLEKTHPSGPAMTTALATGWLPPQTSMHCISSADSAMKLDSFLDRRQTS
jgi:hypothetical protein